MISLLSVRKIDIRKRSKRLGTCKVRAPDKGLSKHWSTPFYDTSTSTYDTSTAATY